MTKSFISKRCTSFSSKLDAIKDQMANLRFELQRQMPYNEDITADIGEAFDKAYIDVKESIDELDYIVKMTE